MEYIERNYRDELTKSGLTEFRISEGESDLAIYAERDLTTLATVALLKARQELTDYRELHEEFFGAMGVVDIKDNAPPIVRTMHTAALRVNIGPMAAVAGAVAEYVGRELLKESSNVIVENGGDIFIATERERVIGIFAGSSALSSKLGVKIPPTATPCGVCTSSSKIGPSISFGNTHTATVIATSTTLADAAATALGNRVRNQCDIEPALEYILSVEGVRGAAVILGEALGAKGDIEFVEC